MLGRTTQLTKIECWCWWLRSGTNRCALRKRNDTVGSICCVNEKSGLRGCLLPYTYYTTRVMRGHTLIEF